MKLEDKFGYTAVKAVELIRNGTVTSSREAWEKAGYQVLRKKVYVNKPCLIIALKYKCLRVNY